MKYGLIVWIGVLLASMLSCQDKPNTLTCVKQDGKFSILNGNQVLLSYQYDILYPPAGVDSSFRRSGFIHPINTPNGQSLTQIQPKDHYHHYGLWKSLAID